MSVDQIADELVGKHGISYVIEPGNLRLKIAENLARTEQTSDLCTQSADIPCEILREVKQDRAKKSGEEGIRLTYLPFFIKAAAYALEKDWRFNSTFYDIKMDENDWNAPFLSLVREKKLEYLTHAFYNIGYAVETDDGLVVLNVKNADTKSLYDIAQETALKASKVKLGMNTRLWDGIVTPDDFRDGTFTVSNVGSLARNYHATYATPIMNYPERAIIATGTMHQAAGGYVLPVSLTFDHALVDGDDAIRFIGYFADLLNSREELLRL